MDHHNETDIEKAGRNNSIIATTDVNLTEAPVTWKAYLLCAFASFGGIFFGKSARISSTTPSNFTDSPPRRI